MSRKSFDVEYDEPPSPGLNAGLPGPDLLMKCERILIV
jgi:hypothetical protein